MQKMRLTTTLFALLLLLITVNCAGNGEPTVEPTPEPSQPPTPEPTLAVAVSGPDCPDSFPEDETEVIREEVEIGAGGAITLTLGSTPSIPCGWSEPEIGDPAVVRQVDYQDQWPAEGVTPVPGAPGTEFYLFETTEEGESTITFRCVCLGEEGAEEELRGTFELNVMSGNNR